VKHWQREGKHLGGDKLGGHVRRRRCREQRPRVEEAVRRGNVNLINVQKISAY